MAALFLVWTLADLTVPGLCKTDNDRSQDFQASTQVSLGSQVSQARVSEAQPVPTSGRNAPNVDEDCFCCCGHIVPAPLFLLPAILDSAPNLTVYHFNQVTASALPLYHPPRS